MLLRNLAKIRRARGQSQAELGARTGFSQKQVSQFENGLRVSHPSYVHIFADALGVEPSALTADDVRIDVTVGGVEAPSQA